MSHYNHIWLVGESDSDITGNPEMLQKGGGPKYAAHMLAVYEAAMAMGSPNFKQLVFVAVYVPAC